MGFRFRRTKNLGPLKVTLSSGGIGASVGVKGARIGVGADGKVRGSVGIPGSGMSYQHTFSGPQPAQQGGHYAPSSGVSWKGLLIVLGVLFGLGIVTIGGCVILIAANQEGAAPAAKPAPTHAQRAAPPASSRR